LYLTQQNNISFTFGFGVILDDFFF